MPCLATWCCFDFVYRAPSGNQVLSFPCTCPRLPTLQHTLGIGILFDFLKTLGHALCAMLGRVDHVLVWAILLLPMGTGLLLISSYDSQSWPGLRWQRIPNSDNQVEPYRMFLFMAACALLPTSNGVALLVDTFGCSLHR